MEFTRLWPRKRSVHEAKGRNEETGTTLTRGDFDVMEKPQEFLDRVDFKTLNSIFDRMQVKTHSDPANLAQGHTIDPKKIVFRYIDRWHLTPAEQDSTEGNANIETGEITLLVPDNHSERGVPRGLMMLQSLIHEATHVRGGYSLEHHTPIPNTDEVRTLETQVFRIGVQEEIQWGQTKEMRRYGFSLSEAITENIAHEVLIEYLTRTGNTSYVKDERMMRSLSSGYYVPDRFVLEVLIKKLATDVQIPQVVVWKSLVSAYMSNMYTVTNIVRDISTEVSLLPIRDLLLKSQSHAGIESLRDEALSQAIPTEREQEEVAHMIRESINVKSLQDALGLR